MSLVGLAALGLFVTSALPGPVSAAKAAKTVADTQALWAAIKAAEGGDRIVLAPGEYSALRLDGARPSGEVTITSADPSKPASIAGMVITSSSGLTFTHIKVQVNPANGFAVQLGSTSRIKFDDAEFSGTAVGVGNAVMVRNSTNVVVNNSRVHHLQTGLNHLNSSQVAFTNNKLHDLQSDGIRGGGSSDVRITGNHFTNFYPKPGDHPDAIQFWTANTSTVARNLVVADNVFVRGEGGAIQGIFVGNESGIPYEDVTITGNTIIGGMYHGISLNYGERVKIANNTVQGFPDMSSWIMLRDVRSSAATDNAATEYKLPSSGVEVSGNRNLKAAKPDKVERSSKATSSRN